MQNPVPDWGTFIANAPFYVLMALAIYRLYTDLMAGQRIAAEERQDMLKRLEALEKDVEWILWEVTNGDPPTIPKKISVRDQIKGGDSATQP